MLLVVNSGGFLWEKQFSNVIYVHLDHMYLVLTTFNNSFYLQTHEVISDAGKSDADKRRKLLDLYKRTEQFMDQFEEDFLEILQKSFEDLNKSLQERKKNVEPSDQYVVLVAGLFCCHQLKRHQSHHDYNYFINLDLGFSHNRCGGHQHLNSLSFAFL